MFITLANVKAFKNITDTNHDEELSRLMPVAQTFIEGYCGRTFEQQAGIVDYYSTQPGQRTLLLRRAPVTVLTSLYDDPVHVYGASTLIPTTDYVLTNAQAGIVTFLRPRICGGVANIKATYTGGFAEGDDTLEMLEHAAIELIWLARDKGDHALLGLSAKSVADSSMTFRNDWPAGVQTILDLYRFARG